ncbi:hypothetical protein [Nostoc sphaeroides]|uniref:hypothetical protein n=1 Tax=Nostoc sphaeroides TaxID=446679 RepID=UPI0015F309DA|nr:hypothetical protein [Nostoc sphaeroides]
MNRQGSTVNNSNGIFFYLEVPHLISERGMRDVKIDSQPTTGSTLIPALAISSPVIKYAIRRSQPVALVVRNPS